MMPRQLGLNLARLQRRAEFLAVANTRKKWVTPGLIVQILPRPDCAEKTYRYGLTASKKVGNAVKRNRARRRLRAIAEAHLPGCALPAADFVLIARPSTVEYDFALLTSEFQLALSKLSRFCEAPKAL